MRVALGLVFFLWIGAISRVLAADPPAPPQPPPAQAEQTPQTTATSTPAPAAAAAKTPVVAQVKTDAVSADGVTKEELKRLNAAGYKQKTRGGQIVYCRVEHQLGTRFDREGCATARDLDFIRANGRELTEQIQKSSSGFPVGR